MNRVPLKHGCKISIWGHAEDIRAAGGGDETLHIAGGWKRRSKAVLHYLDVAQLEMETCMDAHGPAVSDDDD